uniref:Uncharacterized protein n=1 Tax=Ditylenchus dipsaci TaxID=166011 RepID=A0A915E338_9BILA
MIEIRRDVVADLRPLEQVYTETHIKSSYLRSQVEQTPFPSQDRQKITRYHSDAEDHLPQYKPLSRQSRYPPTKHDDPIIKEAIRILEASCQLLDETAIRIAAVNNENQIRPSRDAKDNRSFRFPSEIRRNDGSRSDAESPNQPFAQSTTTTTTKLIKETLTTTNY